ncbi:hypothetical protein [Rhodococcus triatomae]
MAAVVAGGVVGGTGTASAQSEEFVGSVSQPLSLSSESTPEQWIGAGLMMVVLVPLAALDAVSSFDPILGCGLGECTIPILEEQLFDWAAAEFGS